MNKKRTFVIICVALIVVLVGFLLGQTKQTEAPISPSPTIQPAEQPVLPPPAYTTQPNYIVSVFKKVPETLPVYTATSKPAVRVVAASFAALLHITKQPKVISSTRGTIYLWSGNNQSVVANEGLLNIAYAGAGTTGEALTKPIETYYSQAERFVAPLQLSSSLVQLVHNNPRYFSPNAGGANEVNSISRATSVQLDYQYSLNGVPVYTGTTTNPSLSVRLNSNGDVLSFSATVLPALSSSSVNAHLLSYDEAVAKLTGGKGRLTDLVSGDTGDQPYYFNSPPSITDVNSVELAYYYSIEQNYIIPVYAFHGTGKINNKIVNTTTLVSAVK